MLLKPMNNPLGVSPSKGKQGTTLYTLELILCCTVFVFPVLRGTTFLPRVVPCFPLLGLTPSGLFMGLSSI